MQKFLFFVLCLTLVHGQTWQQKASVKDYEEYFTSVIQETVYALEQRDWSILKLTDINRNLNSQIYNIHLNGTVQYTDGFLVSIQSLDITDMERGVSRTNISGVITHSGFVSGLLNMREAKLGYDVIVNLVDGVQRYTGDITVPHISLEITISKNLSDNKMDTGLVANIGNTRIATRMVYRPANHVTEILSRLFFTYDTINGVQSWATTLEPIIMDVITKKIEFPDICFANC